MKILLKNPNERIQGERKSKLLDENSEFYKFILKCRNWLITNGYEIDCRHPHIELLKEFEKNDINLLIKRSLTLHNKEIYFEFSRIGKALVLETGEINGYGKTHCTIAFFPKGLDNEIYRTILQKMCLIK